MKGPLLQALTTLLVHHAVQDPLTSALPGAVLSSRPGMVGAPNGSGFETKKHRAEISEVRNDPAAL